MRTTDFFTQEEIDSQPEIWKRTLERFQNEKAGRLPRVEDYDQVVFTGCGSTYYISVWAARQCEQARGVLCRAVPAGELLMSPQTWLHPGRRTLLVAVSRSAYTTETVRALQRFQEGGYGDDLTVTCYPENQLAKMSQQVLAVPDAQERSMAQTRSFSNMVLALLTLIQREIPAGLPAGLQEAGRQLFARFREVARETGGDPSIQKFIFLGSGPLYGLACEAMLKMKEMSLAYSEAYHFLEFRHGPISVVDGNTLVAALVDGDTPELMLNVIRDVKGLGARVLALSENPLPDPAGMTDLPVVFQSGLPAPWYAPLFLPILQQMALERAMANGQNPDRPANLRAVVEEI